jgi:hypothetical protein
LFVKINFFKNLRLQNFDFLLFIKRKFLYFKIYESELFKVYQRHRKFNNINLVSGVYLKKFYVFLNKYEGSPVEDRMYIKQLLNTFRTLQLLRIFLRKNVLWKYRNQYKYFIFRFFKKYRLYFRRYRAFFPYSKSEFYADRLKKQKYRRFLWSTRYTTSKKGNFVKKDPNKINSILKLRNLIVIFKKFRYLTKYRILKHKLIKVKKNIKVRNFNIKKKKIKKKFKRIAIQKKFFVKDLYSNFIKNKINKQYKLEKRKILLKYRNLNKIFYLNRKFLRTFQIRSITIRKQYRKFLKYKKLSAFGKQVRIFQKFIYFFGGLPRNQIKKAYYDALRTRSFFLNEFLSLLEGRVDIFLYRLNIFKTILEAKQYILHTGIVVNNKVLKSYNFYLKNTDIFSFLLSEKKVIFKKWLTNLHNFFGCKRFRKFLKFYAKSLYFFFKKSKNKKIIFLKKKQLYLKLKKLFFYKIFLNSKKLKKKRINFKNSFKISKYLKKNSSKFSLFKYFKILKYLNKKFYLKSFFVKLCFLIKLLKMYLVSNLKVIDLNKFCYFYLYFLSLTKLFLVLKKKTLKIFHSCLKTKFDSVKVPMLQSKLSEKKIPQYIEFNYLIMSGFFIKTLVTPRTVSYPKKHELLRVCQFIRTI